MSEDDSRYKGSGMKVGALVGVLLLSYFVLPPLRSFFGKTAEITALADPNRVDATMLADPTAGATIKVLKERFPDDYARMRSEVVAAAAARNETALGGIVGDTVTRIVAEGGPHLSRAPHGALDRLSAAELAIYEALQFRPTLCAAFGTPAFDDSTLGPQTRATLLAAVPVRLAAIADGRDIPDASRTLPTPAESLAMTVTALAGRPMRPEVYEMLTGARTPQATTERGRCEASIEILRAVRDMPADEGDALYGSILIPT